MEERCKVWAIIIKFKANIVFYKSSFDHLYLSDAEQYFVRFNENFNHFLPTL
jgi:hypothetical protein